VWVRFVLVTAMLMAIAVSVSSAFVARLATTEIREYVGQRNLQLANRAASEIDFFIESARRNLAELANVVELIDRQPWVRGVLLENYVITTRDFERVMLVDRKGTILADSLLQPSSVEDLDAEAFRRAGSGEAYTSGVRLNSDGLPSMTMVSPVSHSQNIEASLVAELYLRSLWPIMDDITSGKKCVAFVTAADGTLIAHSDKVKLFHWRPSVDLMPSDLGFRVESPVGSLGWTVYIEQPSAEAFLPISLLLRRSFVLVLLIIAVVTFFAFFFVRRISRPLDALMKGTVIIGGGATEYRIPIQSEDEFGVLSSSFNDMVENLQERAVALEDSERKYRIVTESVNDIIYSLDVQGRILFVNGRVERTLGYGVHEMVGKLFTDFVSLDESAARALSFLRDISEGTRTPLPVELPFTGKTGEEVILECEGVAIYEPTGGMRIHGVARDITERKRMEEKLRRTERLSALGEIVSGVAHELRNAVCSIMASMDMLRARNDSGSKKDLDRVLEEAMRAQRIVGNLLDFSKDPAPAIHPCSLNSVIEGSLELCRRELAEGRIKVVMDLDPDLRDVPADPGQLRQVFLNLVRNAIQAMRGSARWDWERLIPAQSLPVGCSETHRSTGGDSEAPRGTLTMTTRTHHGTTSATISDTGPGIPRKHLGHIFDPFFTTNRSGGGTGLGLSVSLRIVHAHGGDIRVQSAEGRGASFTVELPGTAPTDGQPVEEIASESVDLSGKRILVVEDDDSIRDFMRNFLESYCGVVDGAGGVREAVSLLSRALPYDLVISDFRMPEIDGQGLYEWIRSNKPALLCRLVFVTGDGLNPMTRTFLRKTEVPYIFKPVGSLSLMRAITPILLGRKSSGATAGRVVPIGGRESDDPDPSPWG
jgi:PAS domain S-box-containing protein